MMQSICRIIHVILVSKLCSFSDLKVEVLQSMNHILGNDFSKNLRIYSKNDYLLHTNNDLDQRQKSHSKIVLPQIRTTPATVTFPPSLIYLPSGSYETTNKVTNVQQSIKQPYNKTSQLGGQYPEANKKQAGHFSETSHYIKPVSGAYNQDDIRSNDINLDKLQYTPNDLLHFYNMYSTDELEPWIHFNSIDYDFDKNISQTKHNSLKQNSFHPEKSKTPLTYQEFSMHKIPKVDTNKKHVSFLTNNDVENSILNNENYDNYILSNDYYDLDEQDTTQHFFNLTNNYDVGPEDLLATKKRKIFPIPEATLLSFLFKLVVPYGTFPDKSDWSLIGDYRFDYDIAIASFLPDKLRERRSAVAKDRGAIYKIFTNFIDKLGLNGKVCLLRIICEVGENPLTEYGILGELLNFILSPGYILHDSHYEYNDAEKHGIGTGNCDQKFQDCPLSIKEIFYTGISTAASTAFGK